MPPAAPMPAPVPVAPIVRAAKLKGRTFVLALVGVWVAVIAGVTVMIVSFKRGGVDALRIDTPSKQAAPATTTSATSTAPVPTAN